MLDTNPRFRHCRILFPKGSAPMKSVGVNLSFSPPPPPGVLASPPEPSEWCVLASNSAWFDPSMFLRTFNHREGASSDGKHKKIHGSMNVKMNRVPADR
jgi:hypothetical protein